MTEDEIYKEIERRKAKSLSSPKGGVGTLTLVLAALIIVAIGIGGVWAGMQRW